jgi:hypothetical protein
MGAKHDAHHIELHERIMTQGDLIDQSLSGQG